MRNYGTYPSAAATAAGASPRPTEKKPEKVEMIMRLCERCSGRISDRYYMEPRKMEAGPCGLCGREGAAAYAVMPRTKAKPKAAPKDKRARWQEPWRER